MLVQLLYFPSCPHVDAARKALKDALSKVESAPSVVEVDVTAPSTPPLLRRLGSPSILIDGADVAGGEASGSSCRLYPKSDERGAPALAVIENAFAGRY